MFASSLAIHDVFQRLVLSEQLKQDQHVFPNLVQEMESDIQELRALDKEGENLLYSTPWLRISI